MTKRSTYVCDLCGHESVTRLPVATLHDHGTMIARRDVCAACAERVATLLKAKAQL